MVIVENQVKGYLERKGLNVNYRSLILSISVEEVASWDANARLANIDGCTVRKLCNEGVLKEEDEKLSLVESVYEEILEQCAVCCCGKYEELKIGKVAGFKACTDCNDMKYMGCK